jgi:glycine cleavage system H lipoate-binding protein
MFYKILDYKKFCGMDIEKHIQSFSIKSGNIMVVALFLVTVLIFVLLNLILRKEEKESILEKEGQKSPIFLSPEKSLQPVAQGGVRYYHPSHTWIQKNAGDTAYVSIDNFISTLFSSTVKLENLPAPNTYVPQGSKLWDLKINGRSISQLSPISGRIVEINPACKMGIPLPSKEVENSWIVKIVTKNYKNDTNNLLPQKQAGIINSALREELILFAQEDHYLNDGGEIDPLFISSIDENKWNNFVDKFFPYDSKNTNP